MLRDVFGRLSAAALMVTGIAAVQPAQAADFVFPINSATQISNSSNSDGNGRVFRAVSGANDLLMRVSGWSYDGSLVRDSYVGLFSEGLGITSGDDNGGDNGQHTADNEGRWDFFILQFDEAVQLGNMRFSPFLITDTSSNQSNSGDTDATVAVGSTLVPWNQQLALNDTNISSLNAVFSSYLASDGGRSTNTRDVYSGTQFSNIWLIGAARNNPDRYFDSFKLSNLSVTTTPAVPEPSTWAMMILGFGLVGLALRRRRADMRAAIAA